MNLQIFLMIFFFFNFDVKTIVKQNKNVGHDKNGPIIYAEATTDKKLHGNAD